MLLFSEMEVSEVYCVITVLKKRYLNRYLVPLEINIKTQKLWKCFKKDKHGVLILLSEGKRIIPQYHRKCIFRTHSGESEVQWQDLLDCQQRRALGDRATARWPSSVCCRRSAALGATGLYLGPSPGGEAGPIAAVPLAWHLIVCGYYQCWLWPTWLLERESEPLDHC